MREIPTHIKAALAATVNTLTPCLLITCKDGQQFGLVKLDRDVIVDGIVYHSDPGMSLTQLETGSGFTVDNLEITGPITAGLVTEIWLLGGKFDNARYSLFIVDWQQPDAGQFVLQSGRVRDVKVMDDEFSMELASLSVLLNRNIGARTSPTCRVTQFANTRCGIDINSTDPVTNRPWKTGTLTLTDVVLSVEGQILSALTDYPEAFFDRGIITWLSGNNAGLESEVNAHMLLSDGVTGTFLLQERLMTSPQVGDQFYLRAGCDRKFATCRDRQNTARFDGEPFLKGTRKLLEIR